MYIHVYILLTKYSLRATHLYVCVSCIVFNYVCIRIHTSHYKVYMTYPFPSMIGFDDLKIEYYHTFLSKQLNIVKIKKHFHSFF